MFNKKERQMRAVQRKIDRLLPGKTLDDVKKMFDEFCQEMKEIRADKGKDMNDCLECMKRYENVLVIHDMFLDPMARSWMSILYSLEAFKKCGEF